MFEGLESVEDDFFTKRLFGEVRGRSIRDCVALGYRVDPEVGLEPNELESWVLRYRPDPAGLLGTRLELLYGGRMFLSGLWVDGASNAWVGTKDGVVVVAPSAGATPTLHALPKPIYGVHGVRDDLVFAWSEPGGHLYKFDGVRWSEVDSAGQPLRMAGTDERALVLVGYDGLVAWWDGSRFFRVSPASSATVSGVAVHGDRAWATTQSGELLEASSHGTRLRARQDGPLLDVAVWQGEPIVAAADMGLLRPASDSLDLPPVTEPFMAESFARGPTDRLVIACGTGLAETTDLVAFDVLPDLHFEEARIGDRPLWR